MRGILRIAALSSLVFASACFSPAFEDGQISCDLNGICPSGLVCHPITGRCVSEGSLNPDATPVPDAFQGPDADPNRPDARPRPDAMPGSPDAAPGNPDANPNNPDADTSFTPIRININGPTTTGVDYPGTWAFDFGDGDACNGNDGGVVPTTVSGTVDDEIFRYRVYGSGSGVTCAIGNGNLPSGNYEVTLLMAEPFFGPGCPGGGGVGSRVFNISMEGTMVDSNVDIFALGGCVHEDATTPGAPVVKTYDVDVLDGTLFIAMPGGEIQGIQILKN